VCPLSPGVRQGRAVPPDPQDRVAYATARASNDERTAVLDSWQEHYNTALSHFALGGRPPISRLAA
jgi:hypothetical protein